MPNCVAKYCSVFRSRGMVRLSTKASIRMKALMDFEWTRREAQSYVDNKSNLFFCPEHLHPECDPTDGTLVFWPKQDDPLVNATAQADDPSPEVCSLAAPRARC